MPRKRTTQHREEDPARSRFDRIARRAYEIYQKRGTTGGRELEDWLQAEREIDTALSQEAPDKDLIRGM
ncbi:MAG: DUF2934 domain-containing protein [Vicinamibacterales bacterium]